MTVLLISVHNASQVRLINQYSFLVTLRVSENNSSSTILPQHEAEQPPSTSLPRASHSKGETCFFV